MRYNLKRGEASSGRRGLKASDQTTMWAEYFLRDVNGFQKKKKKGNPPQHNEI